MAKKLTYGPGAKGLFTASKFLREVGLDKYVKSAGNGLNIGGLNITGPDHEFRIPQDSESLVVIAPEREPVEVKLSFVNVERTAKEEAEILKRRFPDENKKEAEE
jgi:hypothetical protein